MRCFWCDDEFDELTADHIVPKSLGGTLDFSVQSCGSCQTLLSKAELEVSRKSVLAINALASPLRPRHPDRPTSGNLQPSYLLVKSPLGGYCESLLSSGEKMRSLAYFETKVVPGEEVQIRVRGASSADAQLLLELYRKAMRFNEKLAPGELVCEVRANLELDPEIASDPEFWPRMVLLPGNRIMFRARDPEELVRCAKVLESLARSAYQVDPSKWQSDVQITAGTVHRIGFDFDPQSVRRIAAKIAFALFCTIKKDRLPPVADARMRSYILGKEASPDEPVSVGPAPTTWTTSSDPHFVLLAPAHDRTAAFVNLYAFCFRVDLGEAGILPNPEGIICEIDGSEMRRASDEEIAIFAARMKDLAFSRPWIKNDSAVT